MPDVEFVDPDARPPGVDEELAAGGRERPPRRRLVPAGVAVLVAAAVGIVVLGRSEGRSDGEKAAPSASATLAAPLPIPRPFPTGGFDTPEVTPPAPRCPPPGACVRTGPPIEQAERFAAALRPLVADGARLSVEDTRRGGVLVQRVITAIGDTRSVVISVCRAADPVAPRTLDTKEQTYQTSLRQRGYLVTVQIGDPAGLEGGGIPQGARRIATDPRVLP